MQEMGHGGAPAIVREWLTRVPTWIDVCLTVSVPDAELASLGLGEREAIQLAEEQHADLLLIDESKGGLEAKRRGLRTTGTLGVLLSAGELGMIDSETAYAGYLPRPLFVPLLRWKLNSSDKSDCAGA
jgi:predicted nucleic acid-binding protein